MGWSPFENFEHHILVVSPDGDQLALPLQLNQAVEYPLGVLTSIDVVA
jgi:hypothetical protein